MDDLGCCAECGRRLSSPAAKYCHNACRQRAYRRRHETGGGPESLGGRADSFVGRADDVRRLTTLLRTERMVTVVGVAGAGKSRLVREVLAGEPRPLHYADLGRGDHALDAATDIQDGVLFLDNTDHRPAALAHRLAYLLATRPRLTVVSAGRELWNLPAEVCHRLAGLALPADDNDVMASGKMPDSVRLFVDRSASAHVGFTANDDNLALINAICLRLAGLPLLIEFAAQLTRSLSLVEIAEHACGDLQLLGGGWHGDDPRHRSWQAALRPSLEALDPDERLCLRRISILGDSFAAPAAYAVLRDRRSLREVVSALTRLHDKSLLSVAFPASGTVPARFRLLEPVRLVAGETLTAAGEDGTTRRLLTEWVVEKSAPLCTPALPAEEEVRRLEPEAGRIGTVLADLLARQDPRAARLCAASTTFCRTADDKLSGAVAQLAATMPAGQADSWAVDLAVARLAMLRGEHDAAMEVLRTAANRAGTSPPARRLFLELSVACEVADREAAGQAAARACRTLSLEIGDEVMAAACDGRLARYHFGRGRDEEATRLLGRALPALVAHRPADHLAAALNVLGALAVESGDMPAATRHFEYALRTVDPHGAVAAESMIGLAFGADPRRTVRLLAASGPEPPRSALTRRWATRIEGALAAAECELGARQVRECRRAGAALRRPRAVAYALRAHAADAGPDAEQLSRREWQIVTMVSRGLTNREIAVRLFLSVRTIEAHVRAIRRKVGLRSRTDIATWAVLRDPRPGDSAADSTPWDR